MDFDIVLVSPGHSGTPGQGQLIYASSAQSMVDAIAGRLGASARIGRLRILDSFQGPLAMHPLKSRDELARLRGLFAAGGRVELFAAPAPSSTPSAASTGMQGGFGGGFSGSPIANFGGRGGFGGFQGIGNLVPTLSREAPGLSALLGVPVVTMP